MKNSNLKNNYEFLNNSLSDQYLLKLQIWYQKWPMIIEKIFKIDMKYPLLMFSTSHAIYNNKKLSTQMSVYNDIVESNTENVIKAFEINKLKVDDFLDPFKGHRAIHEAVLFDNVELLKFLIKEEAHLMAKDYSGFSPLLKAVKELIQAGVPLDHKDKKGRNALDLAKLYDSKITFEYLNSLEKNLNSEKIQYWKIKNFKQKYNLSTWVLPKV